MYSHGQLEGKSSSEKQELLFQKGINWNDYPAFFKRGTFVRRRTVLKSLEPAIVERIPERFRPAAGTLVERSEVVELEVPPFAKIVNRVEVVFAGAEPRTVDEDARGRTCEE